MSAKKRKLNEDENSSETAVLLDVTALIRASADDCIGLEELETLGRTLMSAAQDAQRALKKKNAADAQAAIVQSKTCSKCSKQAVKECSSSRSCTMVYCQDCFDNLVKSGKLVSCIECQDEYLCSGCGVNCDCGHPQCDNCTKDAINCSKCSMGSCCDCADSFGSCIGNDLCNEPLCHDCFEEEPACFSHGH